MIETILIWALPVLFAITLHEAAHGWVANRLGDPTARELGRITLNPLKHVDPMGTVVVPLALLFLSGFIIGWAKPVPVDPRHFKQPLVDMALVAIAGPASNFIMACLWALLIVFSPEGGFMAAMGKAGVLINVILMVLNLIPIPPLDGSRVLAGVLPPSLALQYMRIEPFGMMIILVLLFTGVLGKIMWPLVQHFERLILAIFGL
ncbi:MAG: site-2 protease family protein [Gammaproteobacteria bacterium]